MTAIGLIASSFAATNIDNLALLVSWLLTGRERRRQILAGHLLGMFTLLLIAFAFGLGANLIPVRSIGYLGWIPIGLGSKGLYDLLRAGHAGQAASEKAAVGVGPLGIAATQVANGVDTVVVFGPLLADSELGIDLTIVVGFLAMAFLWFGLARLLEKHAARLSTLERYSHWLAPIILILVGFYILANTSTDVLPD